MDDIPGLVLQQNMSTMNESSNKVENFRRVEFWATTTLFVFIIFFFITESVGVDNHRLELRSKTLFSEANFEFEYLRNYFFPQLVRYIMLFAGFTYLNFVVVPQLFRRQNIYLNTFVVALIFGMATLILGVTDTYSRAYIFAEYDTRQEAYNRIFLDAFLLACRLLILLAFYSVLKYASVYLLINADKIQARYRAVTRGGLIAFIVWAIILFLLAVGEAEKPVPLLWGITIPVGILLYWYSFHTLIPGSLAGKRPFLMYILKAIAVLAIGFFAIAFLLLIIVRNGDFAFAVSGINFLTQTFITIPLTWVLFKRHLKGNEELYALKQELGQSNASLDFLRSQINPHFLFNALNTIYGTAIQEKAEKTSEGIQQLGDMMRFMLQENLQDKIPLARETEYLNNYISLQKLRTDAIPQVRIEASIDDTVRPVQIAPMLLIPFVENAFKHGISFREPSHIKISLELRDNALYFDVANNKHPRQEEDPEKNKSGIGLNNVKQRLQHMYPGKHELIIRETTKEFFIHLTIRLAK
jgi:two-component system LytT family sensor kinase